MINFALYLGTEKTFYDLIETDGRNIDPDKKWINIPYYESCRAIYIS